MRLSIVILLATIALAPERVLATQVGVAKIDITPTHPVVLAGYGGRTTEHEGIDTKIWARALAIGASSPVLLVAVDNCGVPERITKRIVERFRRDAGLDGRRITIASTHTHNAPSLPGYARVLWGGRTTAAQEANMERYAGWLVDRVVEVGRRALRARREASLEWGLGRVEFGGNRRIMRDGEWRGFGFQIEAPVDHSLPVLLARDPAGTPFAVWTSYACHCTTLGARNRVHGDWAGYANDAIESAFPGSTSLTTIGCGADVGPQPSGSDANASAHGNAIGAEVRRVLRSQLTPLPGPPVVAASELALPLAPIPDRAHFEELARRRDFDGENARRQLEILAREGSIPTHVRYPVTTWSFGDDLAIVFLPGEVVVDYAVRLKRELDWSRLWINAWANDVPSYIPSKRILREGGYEAEFSQTYYELPTRYAPEVEDVIVSAVHELVPKSFAPRAELGPSPFHTHPKADPARLADPPALSPVESSALENRVAALLAEVEAGNTPIRAATLERALASAQDGFAALEENDGGTDSWFDYTGTKRFRPYVRQMARGATLTWKTAKVKRGVGDRVTLAFIGGLGYLSQPKTEGFELLVNGEVVLRFDATNRPSRWFDEDSKAELLYLPTWTSAVDSGGFFFLVLASDRAIDGESLELGVRSRGRGSLRWFAVDYSRRADESARETLLRK